MIEILCAINPNAPQVRESHEDIALREIHSELYSTSGEYDLLMKLYIPSGEDVGKFINDHLLTIPDIERSLTTMTFKAF